MDLIRGAKSGLENGLESLLSQLRSLTTRIESNCGTLKHLHTHETRDP